ncbi:restriction endonuclease subunit S [Desulfovermiculus halophilus]|uniref:restriction endonuclease subunit S n=1 Tax=Desulfovermiculus halophilus TaxID=339722 RepID=UPI0006874B79|nr:restriction endonuclease subunit S [Desulfovermiculus halophilus]
MLYNQNAGKLLPRSWSLSQIGEVCDILDSYRIPINSKDRDKRVAGKQESDLFPYYGATGQVGSIDDYIFEGEHVLLGEDGAPFLDPFKDKAYIVNGKFWVNNHAHIIKSLTSNKFILYYLNHIDYRYYVTGTTRLKLNQASLKKITVRFPSYYEQHQIVSKIEELFSELDSATQSLKKAQEQLKTYRQSVLKHAFEGKLTEAWRKRQKEAGNPPESAEKLLERIKQEREEHYQKQLAEWEKACEQAEAEGTKKPTKPKKPKDLPPLTKEELADLPELPEGWAWVKLGNLSNIVGGVTKGRKLYNKETSELYYLRVANVQDGYLDLSNLKKIEIPKEEEQKYLLEYGDLLYTEGGDKDKLGRGTVWKNQVYRCIHQNHIFRARLISKDLLSLYFAYFTSCNTAKTYFFSNAKQTVNLASINITILSNLPVPITCAKEQSQITSEIVTV